MEFQPLTNVSGIAAATNHGHLRPLLVPCQANAQASNVATR